MTAAYLAQENERLERELAEARALLARVERLAASQEGVKVPSGSMALSKLHMIRDIVRPFLARQAPEPACVACGADDHEIGSPHCCYYAPPAPPACTCGWDARPDLRPHQTQHAPSCPAASK